MPKRNLLLDYLKGLAILLVTWGHTIQYASSSDYNFFANPVFALIYSFHMPLFMGVSGYLFFQSQAKSTFKQLVRAKVKQVLVPLLLWSVIVLLTNTRGVLLHQPQLWYTVLTPASYLETVTLTLWYLWTSFVCSVLTIIVNKKLSDSNWAYAGLILIVLMLPNAQYFFYVKYMLPYFVAGYLYRKYASQLQGMKQVLSLLSLVVWPAMVLFWNQETYIYTSGPTFTLFKPHELYIVVYRYLTGAFGVILFVTVIKHLLLYAPARAAAAWFGTYSLGIYVIGFVANSLFVTHLHLPHSNTVLYSLVYTPVVALAVAIATGAVTQLISRVSLLNKYLLGGRSTRPAPVVTGPEHPTPSVHDVNVAAALQK